MPSSQSERTTSHGFVSTWMTVVSVAILAVFFYVSMEWLFFATKPSFMSTLSLSTTWSVLPLAAAPLTLVVALCLLVFVALASVSSHRIYRRSWALAGWAVPALILAASGLLLIDNFTLTVFGFGVRSTVGVERTVYLFVLAALFLTAWKTLQKTRHFFLFQVSALAVVCLLAVGLLVLAPRQVRENVPMEVGTEGGKEWPNILLISSDGLDASHLSVYGYERETTPFLKAYSRRALLIENAFTNAGPTGASLVAALTSKLPTQTRMIYPPDILTGQDSFEHLPIILRRLGYSSIQLSIRHYGDAYDANLRESFDVANFRQQKSFRASNLLTDFLGLETGYFLEQMQDRLQSRLLHSLSIEDMTDVYQEVTTAEGLYRRDSVLLKEFFTFIDGVEDGPFFAQIHLLGTHGRLFRPIRPHFSKGLEQTEPWMTDFYDDSIRDFDRNLQYLVGTLRRKGKLDNTILVVYSDHPQRYRTGERIPLLFFFPGDAPRGRVRQNGQIIDIAPTLLDYLKLTIPDWMEGRSLVAENIPALEPILCATRRSRGTEREEGLWVMSPDKAGPPFYSLGGVRATFCHKTFLFELMDNYLVEQSVPGHTAPCPEAAIPDPRAVEEKILGHLRVNGYAIPADRERAAIHVLD